jgi:hypothetical protein
MFQEPTAQKPSKIATTVSTSKTASPSVSPTRHNSSQPSPSLSSGNSRLTKPRRSSTYDALVNFQPLANDLLTDLDTIDKLTEVRTEIGLARAFVRLSLEKKLLGEHVKQLLSDGELLRWVRPFAICQ